MKLIYFTIFKKSLTAKVIVNKDIPTKLSTSKVLEKFSNYRNIIKNQNQIYSGNFLIHEEFLRKLRKSLKIDHFTVLLLMLWTFCDSCVKGFYAAEIKSATTFPKLDRIPFQSTTELASLVEKGSFRLMNHIQKPPMPLTQKPSVKLQFERGFEKYKYFFNPSANNSVSLFAPLLNNSNLVYITYDALVQADLLEVPFAHQLLYSVE